MCVDCSLVYINNPAFIVTVLAFVVGFVHLLGERVNDGLVQKLFGFSGREGRFVRGIAYERLRPLRYSLR